MDIKAKTKITEDKENKLLLQADSGLSFDRRLNHPPFTHYPFPPRSLECGGQTSPHNPRLVVSHNTCPPLSSSPHAHSFVLGTAVINNNLINAQ
jgi:hypothetical protein